MRNTPVSYTHLINQYVRFVDEEPDKRKNDWKLNDRWAWFIGDNRQSLKLTTKPEPYTLDRTLRWVQRQVAPTLKMLKKIDKGNGTDYMEMIEQQEHPPPDERDEHLLHTQACLQSHDQLKTRAPHRAQSPCAPLRCV